MRIVSVTNEAGGKVFELEDSVVGNACWVNRTSNDGLARPADLEILRKLLVDGVFYVGLDDWRGKRFLVTLSKGANWSVIEPRVRSVFESLPHVRHI